MAQRFDNLSGEAVEEELGRLTKRDIIREDRRLTVRKVGDMHGIGKSSVQRILSDLSMTKVCARWVPPLLHEDQMQSRDSALTK